MNKRYVFTDVHGMYDLWEQIRDFCDETDTIYFLGDACDRGPDGMKIITELLKDRRVIYLKGNHEDFLVRAGHEAMEARYGGNVNLWYRNGGSQTYKDFCKLHELSQDYYIRKLSELPTHLTITNTKGQEIILSHAGVDPAYIPTNDFDWIWDREHIYYDFPEGEEYANTYVIHGHTPVPHLAYRINAEVEIDDHEIWEPLIYANGHKICLDMGSFTSNKIVLFDLDEMKVAKTFYCGKEKEKEKCLTEKECKKE